MFNRLIIYVIQAKGLHLKNKTLDVYVSLNTSGKSKWKSKVSTNAIRTEDGNCHWNERCEFELNELDTEIHIYVNYKTVFGTTEILGEKIFFIKEMDRYVVPTWFSLTKKHSTKERGKIQLEYQFDYNLNMSVSNYSLNKIEKEKIFNKVKHKMNNIVHKKKAIKDCDSNISVFISRKSSFSSNTSALAFSSPSSNLHNNDTIFTSNENILPSNFQDNYYLKSPTSNQLTFNLTNDMNLKQNSIENNFVLSEKRNSLQSEKLLKNHMLDTETSNIQSPINITKKMRFHAEQIRNFCSKKSNFEETDELVNKQTSNFSRKNCKKLNNTTNDFINSRPCSIASSSGFASLNSYNIETLNENTSSEHLYNVVKYLQHQLILKDNRIRDLEQYTDKLLAKIIIYNPEFLEISPKILLEKTNF